MINSYSLQKINKFFNSMARLCVMFDSVKDDLDDFDMTMLRKAINRGEWDIISRVLNNRLNLSDDIMKKRFIHSENERMLNKIEKTALGVRP